LPRNKFNGTLRLTEGFLGKKCTHWLSNNDRILWLKDDIFQSFQANLSESESSGADFYRLNVPTTVGHLYSTQYKSTRQRRNDQVKLHFLGLAVNSSMYFASFSAPSQDIEL
jgi:hypothetical protein